MSKQAYESSVPTKYNSLINALNGEHGRPDGKGVTVPVHAPTAPRTDATDVLAAVSARSGIALG